MALFIWTCPVFVEKVQELFREKPLPFHMQVAIQSNHLHLIIQSNHVRLMCWRCLRPNRSIGHSSSRRRLGQSWLMFAVPHSSDQNSWFEHGEDIQWSEVPAIEVSVPYLLPLNLRKTSRAPIYIWQKQATHHSSETCLCTLDLPIVDLMVPVQYRCINLSEITRGHPLEMSSENPMYICEPMCRCSCRLINKWNFPVSHAEWLQIVAATFIVPSSDLQLWPQVGQPRLFCGEHLTISFRTLKQKWLEAVTCRLPVRKKKEHHAGGKC